MKILIDTNIVIDVILQREPFCRDALTIFQYVDNRKLEGYIAATTITNIFYIIRKVQGRTTAFNAIKQLQNRFKLCSVNQETIETALHLNLKDFEDSVQLACALGDELDGIVTRDR